MENKWVAIALFLFGAALIANTIFCVFLAAQSSKESIRVDWIYQKLLEDKQWKTIISGP